MERAGRGLDIENLVHVILLVPIYVHEKDNNVTQSQIKQSVGRVARGGKTGLVTVIYYGDILNIEVEKWIIPIKEYIK